MSPTATVAAIADDTAPAQVATTAAELERRRRDACLAAEALVAAAMAEEPELIRAALRARLAARGCTLATATAARLAELGGAEPDRAEIAAWRSAVIATAAGASSTPATIARLRAARAAGAAP